MPQRKSDTCTKCNELTGILSRIFRILVLFFEFSVKLKRENKRRQKGRTQRRLRFRRFDIVFYRLLDLYTHLLYISKTSALVRVYYDLIMKDASGSRATHHSCTIAEETNERELAGDLRMETKEQKKRKWDESWMLAVCYVKTNKTQICQNACHIACCRF